MSPSLPGTCFIDSTLRSLPLHLPVRTVVFELRQARVLFSPGSRLTPEQLRDAGAITDIVAPSLMHTAGMKRAAEVHPTARLWGPVGAREKHPDLTWHGMLGVDPWPWEAELPVVPLAGMPKVNESLFLHHASGALYATDMVFNVRDPKGPGAWLIFRMFGTWRRFAVSRLFLGMVKDKAAFRASIARLPALEFRHVVPSHGEPVMNDGKARLIAALRERGLIDADAR